MHHNNSEVLAFKKWFVPNTSVRATLNLQPDQDVKKIIPHVAHPLPKNKSISITNNKNMQSFSTSALPYYHPTELVNNCQAGTSTPTKNMDYIDSSVNDLSTESLQRVKKNTHDPQFQNPIFRKDSLSHRQQLPGYNKSTAQLNRFNLRQTTSNNSSAPFIPKHKQPEWLQKIQLYSKTTKSTKMNLIDKISQNQKEQETSPTFQVIHDSPKKNNQDQKLFFRQTLDPQMDRNFGEPKIPSLSPNYFSKRLKEKESKDLSQTKIDKTPKKESKNKTHNMQGGFWKNKAVSPPSKPWPPQKNDLGMSKEISVPPLPIHAHEKVPAHKPSFFLSKKSLNRFSIMKQLGSGSISDAFLCMDKKCNAIFCLKRYHKATIKNFPEVLDNFIKKVAFQFLAQDPNIIQLYDIFCDGQFIYTIQQYMQSGKLSQNIQKEVELRQQKRRQTQNFTNTTTKQQEEPLFNQSKIIDKIYDINSALCYIHQSYDSTPKIGKKKMPPLVHGDVRTKSILVSMGVCKLPAIEPANIKSYYINSYSPPEQIIEQVYITKSDIWNLGLILFELCAERKLFGHESQGEHSEDDNKPGYQVFNVNITQEIDKLSGTTQLLKDLMKKLLAIQPEDRPSSSKVMESHVFRMYGFDVEWKQRRNEKIMKIKDMKEMDKDRYKKHSISLQELKLESEVYSKKQAQFINTLGKNSINLNLSRDLNCTHESNEVTESTPPTKTYWTGKSRLSAEKKY